MSETEATTIDASVVPPAIETTEASETPSTETSSESTVTQPSAPANDRPAGYSPVDVRTASPEQVQQRLDYLYGQIKPTQRENKEMRQLLEQQSKVIDELSKTTQGVVTHLTERSFADSEALLTRQMQEAWQRQDNKAYIEAQNKLMDLRVEQRVLAKTQVQQPQKTNAQPNSAVQIAERAMQNGEINHDDYRITEQWQGEKDESGNLLRPWAFEGDPNYQAALFEGRSVLANPRFAHLTYQQKLEEIDRRMGTQKRTVQPNVMGGNLTKPAKSVKITLSPKQREIALKTQYAGKGKPEAEHLEKYRQQIEKYDASKRRAK